MNPFIRVHTGKKFYFLRPTVKQLDIVDIAYALSGINRFTGHTRYNVAQHCCYCCDNVSENIKLEALMHDASEAYTGDCNSPLKLLLPQFKEIEQRVEKVIAKKFKLVFPFPAGVKTADLIMLATEMRDLMNGADYKDLPFEPLKEKIQVWDSERSHKEFLDRYEKYKR